MSDPRDNTKTLLRLKEVSTRFYTPEGVVRAVDRVGFDICAELEPPMAEVEPDHWVSCHLYR